MNVREQAPAKVNLALHVTGLRGDGYHFIESLSVFLDQGDRIEVSSADADRFEASGPFAAALPPGSHNLVLRARDLLRNRFPQAGRAVRISLDKHLPIASGVGGGSADAAAALRALTRLWEIEVSANELCALSQELGADLPMCILSRPLIARGIGEMLEPRPDLPRLHLLLANPGVAVATPAVFKALSNKRNPPLPLLPSAPSPSSVREWLERTRNDLEAPARQIAPAIDETLAALSAQNALLVRMSGSGATCFGLFGSRADAERSAASLKRSYPQWFVTAASTLDGLGERNDTEVQYAQT